MTRPVRLVRVWLFLPESVVLPQRQPYSVWLEPAVNVDVVVAFDSGISETTEVFTTVEMPCTVAKTPPLTSVCTPATYLVCCEVVVISQPQPSAAGAVVGPD